MEMVFKVEDYSYAAQISGFNIATAVLAYICSHNAEMFSLGESLCKKYAYDAYVTATVDYDNLVWISSVKVRKGK